MLLDRASNPGPLTCKSGALPIALRGPALLLVKISHHYNIFLTLQASNKNCSRRHFNFLLLPFEGNKA